PPPAAADAAPRVLAHVLALGDRHLADRLRHADAGDLDAPLRDLFGAPPVPEPLCDLFEGAQRAIPVQGEREAIRLQAPEDQVDVREGELAAVGVPIAERAGACARAVGSDGHAVAVEAA